MHLVADTHVHIYPFYEVERALETVLARLSGSGKLPFTPKKNSSAVKVACLTERYDCNVYQQLQNDPPAAVTDTFEIASESDSLRITRRADGAVFYLLPGQQIITAENIEVLSLSTVERVQEGQSAADTVRAVLAAGGLPVVAWAPGKWFGRRGAVVRSLLDEFSAQELALGDTTLRPLGWLLPLIMRNARSRGFKILYGSDPLPFRGEEKMPGSYYSVLSIETADTEPSPAAAIRNLLSSGARVRSAGSRGRLLQVLSRLYRNHRAPVPERSVA